MVFVPGGDASAESHSSCLRSFPVPSGAYPTTRGAAETPPLRIALDDTGFSADCAALMDGFCGGQAVVCGLSLGGLVTQQAAIDFPEKVSLAIPVDTAAHIGGFTCDWLQAVINLRQAGIALPTDYLAPHFARSTNGAGSEPLGPFSFPD